MDKKQIIQRNLTIIVKTVPTTHVCRTNTTNGNFDAVESVLAVIAGNDSGNLTNKCVC